MVPTRIMVTDDHPTDPVGRLVADVVGLTTGRLPSALSDVEQS